MGTKSNYDSVDLFYILYEPSILKTDKLAKYKDLIKPIRKLEKCGVKRFPDFYKLLNDSPELKPKGLESGEINDLAFKLILEILKEFVSTKTRNNAISSDMNVFISDAVSDSPLYARKIIIDYISDHKRAYTQLFIKQLDELIKSIEDQKNEYKVKQSENKQNMQNGDYITYTSSPVIPFNCDDDDDIDDDNDDDIFNPFGNMQNGDNHNDDDGNENEYYIYNPLTDIL